MKRIQSKLANNLIRYLLILIGTFAFATSVYAFTAPNHIAPGGVTGLATAINFILPSLPIGIIVSIINIPLLSLGYRFLGKKFILKTLISTLTFSLLYDTLFPLFMPVYTGDYMLASLFGGVLSGFGLAVVFTQGGSTGGTDITNRIIQAKLPHISLGKIVLVSDVVVIVFAAFVFKNIESAMYAIVAMFVASKVLDNVLYGADVGKMITIVTRFPKQICDSVDTSVNRGCTIVPAKGGYTGEEKSVIICAVKKNQFYKLKRAVYAVDPQAFLMVSDASEVVGEGFKQVAE